MLVASQLLSCSLRRAAMFFPLRHSANEPMCTTQYWFSADVECARRKREQSHPPRTGKEMKIQKRSANYSGFAAACVDLT